MKWLVVGAGSIGAQHIEVLAGTEGQEVACVEPDEDRWNTIGEHCKTRVSKTLEEGLKAGQPDVALICTPTHLHITHALVCAATKCHVIVEKPVSSDTVGIDALIADLKYNGKIGMVAGQFRFHPGLLEVKKIIDAGKSDDVDLGPIVSARAEYGETIGAWRLNVHYANSHSAKKAQGGGLFFDRIHEFEYLMWLFGKPTSVYATTAKRTDLKTDVEDVAEVILDFNGIPVSIHLDMVQKMYRMTLEVVFENDVVQWVNTPAITAKVCLVNQVQHWLKVFDGKEEPVQTIEDGYEVLRVALAAYESAEKGVKVELGDAGTQWL